MVRQDASFYTNSNDYEIVFDGERFAVIRNGEMRINIRKSVNDEWSVLRYTEDLEGWGITTDEELDKWSEQTGLFEWWNNSWFEIVDKRDWSGEYDVFEKLSEAVTVCERMNRGEY